MARDYMEIGSAPANEPTAQVGSPNYYEEGRAECTRFLNLIRKTLGDEPPGARLAVKSNPHDFGAYYSVVCHYEDTNEEASRYAMRCENEAPTNWGEPGDEPADPPAAPEPVRLNIDQVMAAAEDDDGSGFCLACGDQASGVEPDARNYECDSCGEKKVFGAQEILMMGSV